MDEREGHEAQQEAQHEAAGATSQSTRERLWGGLTKYLTAEVAHARKAARSDGDAGRQR